MTQRSDAELLEERLGYTFTNRALLQQALTHSTYANEHPGEGPSNERLEFLGDAVVGLVAAQLLFTRFSEESEGELTRRRARVVRREALAELGLELRLNEAVRLGQGQRAASGGATARVLADAFEALVGAAFLDGGLQAVEGWIGPRFAAAIDAAAEPSDFKTDLQEACHRRGLAQPRYVVTSIEGPDHDRRYTSQVIVGDDVLGIGVGSSKKKAEQEGAQQALARLAGIIG